MIQGATKNKGQKSITYINAKIYNLLSRDTKEIKYINASKKRLKH